MLQGAAVDGCMPRTLSFTATMQMLAASWVVAAVIKTDELIALGNQASTSQRVANRPDRVEPRANKRRPKLIALLNKPRKQAIQELMNAAA
jgi:hypothetical protein